MRELRAQTAKSNKQEKLNQMKILKQKQKLDHEDEILKIKEKLATLQKAKSAELEKFAKELSDTKKKQKEWQKQYKQIQQLRWQNYSQGLERSIRCKQNETIAQYKRHHESQQKQMKQRQLNTKRLRDTIENQRNNYDQSLSLSRTIQNKVSTEEMKLKTQQVALIQQAKKNARDKYLHAKPFEKMLEQTRQLKKTKHSLSSTTVTNKTATSQFNQTETANTENNTVFKTQESKMNENQDDAQLSEVKS